MKIIRLKAENIKKLVAVEITPTGSVIKITGKNSAGKTSVLDAIFWALGGLNNIQAQPIRKGQTKAKVEIDLGEMVVKRTFNEGGTTSLTIENKDGLRFKSPQTMLDGLLGKLSFDPLEFMRQDSRKQFETLRQLTGVDFSKLDGLRQRTYDERAATNRDVRRLEVQIEGMSVPPTPVEVDKEEVGVTELAGKIADAVEKQKAKSGYERIVVDIERDKGLVQRDATHIDQQILDLEKRISQGKMAYKAHMDSIKDFEDKIENMKEAAEAVVVPDLPALQNELKTAEEGNRTVREAIRVYREATQRIERIKEDRKSTRDNLQQLKDVSENLTDKIQGIDEEKQKQITEAKFPLDGLSFGDGAVTYNDLPMDQASHAEQLRVSMAMAMSLNPKLKVIRITDGSLLDSQSMKVIEGMAKDQDYQVWIEQMDESGKVGIVISEGEVVAVNE